MKKMLKIMALLLVLVTVVFAAGCTEQGEDVVDDANESVADAADDANESAADAAE